MVNESSPRTFFVAVQVGRRGAEYFSMGGGGRLTVDAGAVRVSFSRPLALLVGFDGVEERPESLLVVTSWVSVPWQASRLVLHNRSYRAVVNFAPWSRPALVRELEDAGIAVEQRKDWTRRRLE